MYLCTIILKSLNRPYANLTDHSVVARDMLHESEASWALVSCFHNASSKESCFVDDLVGFISLYLRVFVFLNATRKDRNYSTIGKVVDACNSLRGRKFVRYIFKLEDLRKSFKCRPCLVSGGVKFQHDLHGQYLPQSKEKLLLKHILCPKRRSCLFYSDRIVRIKYYGGITKRMNFSCPLR